MNTEMRNNTLNFIPAFISAWDIYKANPLLYVQITLSFFAAWVTLEIIVITGEQLGSTFNIAIHLIFLILSSGMAGGFLKISRLAWTHQHPTYNQLYDVIMHSPKYFAAGLIYLLGSTLGLLLFLIPGLIVVSRYSFFGFILIQEDPNPLEALRRSSRLVGSNWGRLLGAFLILFILNIMGSAFLGLGLFITIPVSVLTVTGLYLQSEEIQRTLDQGKLYPHGLPNHLTGDLHVE